MNGAQTAYFRPRTPERQNGVELMIRHAKAGGAIVFGTMEALNTGQGIGNDGEYQVVVTGRATRDDFLLNCPAAGPLMQAGSAPFYWHATIRKIATP